MTHQEARPIDPWEGLCPVHGKPMRRVYNIGRGKACTFDGCPCAGGLPQGWWGYCYFKTWRAAVAFVRDMAGRPEIVYPPCTAKVAGHEWDTETGTVCRHCGFVRG